MTKIQNKKSLKNLNFFIWICLGFIVLSLGFVKAVKALTITVIPPQLEVQVEPGQVITKTLKVKNETDQDLFLKAAPQDFIVNDESGTPLFIEEDLDNRWAASSWIQLSPTQIRLKPGELVGIQMTVLAPQNASPGGRYAAVLYSPDITQTTQETASLIEPRAGTLVYITIPGDVKQDAKVTKFELPKFLEYGPINILTTIINLSDIHITPVGHISIKNTFGKTVANLGLTPTNIFPYASRNFENTLDRRWLFGRYQAQLTATYGTAGQVLLATAYLWVIPWKLIIAILAIIILIFTIIKLNKQNKSQKFDTTPSEELKKKYSDKK